MTWTFLAYNCNKAWHHSLKNCFLKHYINNAYNFDKRLYLSLISTVKNNILQTKTNLLYSKQDLVKSRYPNFFLTSIVLEKKYQKSSTLIQNHLDLFENPICQSFHIFTCKWHWWRINFFEKIQRFSCNYRMTDKFDDNLI